MANIHSDLCSAIYALGPSNSYAFVPMNSFVAQEELESLSKLRVYNRDNLSLGFSGLKADDDEFHSFSDENGDQLILKSLIAKIYNKDEENQIIDSIGNIVRAVSDKTSSCLNSTNHELSFHFSARTSKLHRSDEYFSQDPFHRDFENSDDSIRITVALTGKGTAFKNYDSSAVEFTPEFHLAVFTQGDNFGAIHGRPVGNMFGYQKISDYYNVKYEDVERFVVIITGKSSHLSLATDFDIGAQA